MPAFVTGDVYKHLTIIFLVLNDGLTGEIPPIKGIFSEFSNNIVLQEYFSCEKSTTPVPILKQLI